MWSAQLPARLESIALPTAEAVSTAIKLFSRSCFAPHAALVSRTPNGDLIALQLQFQLLRLPRLRISGREMIKKLLNHLPNRFGARKSSLALRGQTQKTTIDDDEAV
jgi:hypothetical protein